MSTPSCKLVVIGDSGVGKSSLVRTYLLNLNNSFPHNYNLDRIESTIGAAYYTVQLDDIKLQIWDTAGQERFRSICPIYFRGSSGCICVFDVTNRKSFENVNSWITSFREHAPLKTLSYSSPLDVLLVANKTDLHSSSWEVSLDEIITKSKFLNCPFILTSTLEMSNFADFRDYIKSKYTLLGIHTSENIMISNTTSDSSCIPNCVNIG